MIGLRRTFYAAWSAACLWRSARHAALAQAWHARWRKAEDRAR